MSIRYEHQTPDSRLPLVISAKHVMQPKCSFVDRASQARGEAAFATNKKWLRAGPIQVTPQFREDHQNRDRPHSARSLKRPEARIGTGGLAPDGIHKLTRRSTTLRAKQFGVPRIDQFQSNLEHEKCLQENHLNRIL